jgi:hypothetical protein
MIGAPPRHDIRAHMAARTVLDSRQPGDPLAKARARGARARREILRREGGAWTAEQVTAHTGLSQESISQQCRAGKLIGLLTDRQEYVYPSWQFEQNGILPGLEETLAALTVRDPWVQAAFFVSGDPRLNGATPLDELRRGNVDAVQRAARGYGEHGAA